MNRVDPKKYGLHARTVLEQVDDNILALIMDRKSRIIRADGKKILEKVDQIHKVEPGIRVRVKTSAPICSKTLTLLHSAGLTIAPLEPGKTTHEP